MLRGHFIKNLDVVFFIYGLAFVIMGISILIQPRKGSKFKLAGILWILAGFGLTHGTNEFLDMWAIIKGKNPAYDILRWFILAISFLFLFEFGRQLFYAGIPEYSAWRKKIAKLLSWRLLPLIGVFIFISGLASVDFWKTGSIWARYLLGFPGSILSGLGFFLYYKFEKEILQPLKVKKYFLGAGVAFIAYGILGGLVVPKADFFPSNWLNADTFLSTVKIPVQSFRALCAIIVSWAVWGILRIFNWEQLEKLYLEITERKQAEEELRNAYERLKETQAQLMQSEKLAAVGQLAAGAAHEINNPLFVISGEAEMLLKGEHKKDKETQEASKAILDQAERIQGIIKRLLELSRQKEIKQEPLNINKLLEESIPLLSHQVKLAEIEIVKELAAGLPEPLGDKRQVQEVFLNIILNAVEAMDNRGRLTMRTYSTLITEYGRRETDKFKLGQRIVVIEVKDTGKGMDEGTLKKLFSPFFTTKEKGAGLGLFICYEIIDNHKGAIEAHSKLGEGSTFTVKLPVFK